MTPTNWKAKCARRHPCDQYCGSCAGAMTAKRSRVTYDRATVRASLVAMLKARPAEAFAILAAIGFTAGSVEEIADALLPEPEAGSHYVQTPEPEWWESLNVPTTDRCPHLTLSAQRQPDDDSTRFECDNPKCDYSTPWPSEAKPEALDEDRLAVLEANGLALVSGAVSEPPNAGNSHQGDAHPCWFVIKAPRVEEGDQIGFGWVASAAIDDAREELARRETKR